MSTEVSFAGFDEPLENWSKLPHSFVAALPLVTSMAELKVIIYVLRHTWGYKEYETGKTITTDEFMHGRKKKDGSRIDGGVGMEAQAIRNGLSSAEKHGFLVVEVNDTDKARVKKSYSLHNNQMDENHPSDGWKSSTNGMKVTHRSEKETSAKKPKVDAPKRTHQLFPVQFPSNVKSYTDKQIAAYFEQHTTDLVALIHAWHGEMYDSFANISKIDSKAYIELHREMVRLNKPSADYLALAKCTREQEAWKLKDNGTIRVSDMLRHVTDYKPIPTPVTASTGSMATDAKLAHDYEEMFGAKH